MTAAAPARRVDRRARLRHVSSPGRTPEQRRQPALGRRAADAGDFARAGDQSAPPYHGRADRGAGARHRRSGRGDAGPPRRGKRHRDPRHRAEYRRRDDACPRTSRSWSTGGSTESSNSRRLAADRDLQQRLLGVGRHSEVEAGRRGRSSLRIRAVASTVSEVKRRAGKDLCFQPDAADALVAADSQRAHRIERPHRLGRRDADRRWRRSGDRTRRDRARAAGRYSSSALWTRRDRSCASSATSSRRAVLRTRLVDVSTSGKLSTCDVTAQEIALNHGRGGPGVFGRERGASVAAMAEAFETWIKRQGDVAGDYQRRRVGRRVDRCARACARCRSACPRC